jgi:hypothetical protein
VKNVTLASAALLVVVAAGCTSSSKPSAAPVSPSTSAVTSPSVSSSAPAPSPTATKPLSPFEADPAVMALRAWAAEAARTVNTGKYDSPALDQLMTPAFAKGIKAILGEDVGLTYPGPIPLQPVGVEVTNAHARVVKVCDMYEGFARSPKTKRPARAAKIAAADVYVASNSGRWLVDDLTLASGFSCKGVKVARPTW